MELYEHQVKALEKTKDKNRVAYFHDMGLGKTFTGAEKMKQLGGRVNLVVCQKSKVDDWVEHFRKYYPFRLHDNPVIITEDLTNEQCLKEYAERANSFDENIVLIGVINYDLIIRRPELLQIKYNTIMLDESSMIKNDTAKRTKAILKMKTDNAILLSGTPTGGKYEELYSQLKLLGWKITKADYWKEYIKTHKIRVGGFTLPIVTGYKNIGGLKRKMREHGCHFLKTSEVFDLPAQTYTEIKVAAPPEYQAFVKNELAEIDGDLFVGDTVLKKLLFAREICGAYAPNNIKALSDLIESTADRLIIFYNFNIELEKIRRLCMEYKRPFSQVNGTVKDLNAYETKPDSITAIQYQSGAMGLNLQKANKIIYFSPPLSSELFEQSKKRIHRIGQKHPCFYYQLICKNTVETKIYNTLEKRQDYTELLFKKGGF